MTNESASSHGQNQRKSTLNHNSDNLEKSRKFRWSSCFSFISKIKKNNRQTRIRASQSYEALDQDDKDDNKITELIEDTSMTWKEQQMRDRLKLELKQQNSLQLKHQQQEQLQQAPPFHPIQQQIITPSSALSPPPRQSKAKRETISSAAELNAGRRPLVDPTLTPKVKPRSNKKKQPSLLRLSLDADMLQTSSSSSHDTTISSLSNQSDSDSISCKTARSSSDHSFIPFRSGTLGGMLRSRLSLTSAPPLPPPQIVIPPLPDSRSSSDILASHVTAESPLSYSSNSNTNSRPNSDGLTIKERRKRTSPASIPSVDHLTIALKEWVDQQSEDHHKYHYHHHLSQFEDKNSNDENNNNNNSSNVSKIDNHTANNTQENIQEKYRQDAMLSLEGKKSKAVSAQPIANTRELDYHFEKKTEESEPSPRFSEQKTGTCTRDLVRDKAQYEAIVSRTMVLRRQSSQEERQPNNSRPIPRIKSAACLENNEESKQEKPLGIICENEILLLSDKSGGPASAMYDTKMLLPIPSHLVPPETPPHHIQSAPSLVSSPSTPNSFESSMYEQDDYVSPQLTFVHSSIQ